MRTLLRNFTIVATVLIAVSCNNQRKLIEPLLKETLPSDVTYKFIEIDKGTPITLADELAERYEYFSAVSENEQKSIDGYLKLVESYSYLATFDSKYKEELAETKSAISEANERIEGYARMMSFILSATEDNTDMLNDQTFTEYRLKYNAGGQELICTARVDNSGNVVSLRPNEDAIQIILGNCFSIPGYYEQLDKIKE